MRYEYKKNGVILDVIVFAYPEPCFFVAPDAPDGFSGVCALEYDPELTIKKLQHMVIDANKGTTFIIGPTPALFMQILDAFPGGRFTW